LSNNADGKSLMAFVKSIFGSFYYQYITEGEKYDAKNRPIFEQLKIADTMSHILSVCQFFKNSDVFK
jgi:hypothetical protein